MHPEHPSGHSILAATVGSVIWGGLHFRSATEAGEAMGRRVGALAAERLLAPQP